MKSKDKRYCIEKIFPALRSSKIMFFSLRLPWYSTSLITKLYVATLTYNINENLGTSIPLFNSCHRFMISFSLHLHHILISYILELKSEKKTKNCDVWRRKLARITVISSVQKKKPSADMNLDDMCNKSVRRVVQYLRATLARYNCCTLVRTRDYFNSEAKVKKKLFFILIRWACEICKRNVCTQASALNSDTLTI